MKAKLFIIAIAALTTFAIIGCGKDDTNPVKCTCPNGTEKDAPCTCGGEDCHCTVKETPKPIARQFTITGFAKDITVKDMRTGADDVDLETLGIISRVKGGLNEAKLIADEATFNEIVERGIVIVIEETTEYVRIKPYSGNKLGLNFTYISTDDENLATRIVNQIGTMYWMEPDSE